MLSALADPAFDPTAEVLLQSSNPQSAIRNPQSAIRNPQSLTLQDTPNRVTIHAVLDAPGYLVLADTWYPGWQAAVDGEPVELLRANYSFRAVAMDAGDHVIEMSYHPMSVWLGLVLSLCTLILVIAMQSVRFWRG